VYKSGVYKQTQSEYAAAHQERRHFISNFTGSAGTALVTTDQALLWTDGRYFLQVSTCSLLTTPSRAWRFCVA